MKYLINNIKYDRVTECIKAYSCPYSAYLDLNHPKKDERPIRVEYRAVRGTITHHKIESFLQQTEGLPKKKREPFVKGELKLIKEDLEKPPAKQLIIIYAEHAFKNFLKWWEYAKEIYNIQVVYAEEKLFSVSLRVAGTTDIIAIIKIDGKKYLMIIDFKSGKMWIKTYSYQTTAYRMLVEEMVSQNKLKLPKLEWYDKGITLMLGGTEPEEVQSAFNPSGFLSCLNVYRHPVDKGTQSGCDYCGDYYRCKYRKETKNKLEFAPEEAFI